MEEKTAWELVFYLLHNTTGSNEVDKLEIISETNNQDEKTIRHAIETLSWVTDKGNTVEVTSSEAGRFFGFYVEELTGTHLDATKQYNTTVWRILNTIRNDPAVSRVKLKKINAENEIIENALSELSSEGIISDMGLSDTVVTDAIELLDSKSE